MRHLDRYIDEFEFRSNDYENPSIFRDALNELLPAENLEHKVLVA